ncbi:MAG: hemolysin III family protein, partial [Actinomycetota bacterium]
MDTLTDRPAADDPRSSALPLVPRWRGRLHQVAFIVSIPMGLVLVALAGTTSAKIAAVVYSFGVSALYGTSAAYHRGRWSAPARKWMKRLDHSMISVLIAATYTPFALLVLEGRSSVLVLVGV